VLATGALVAADRGAVVGAAALVAAAGSGERLGLGPKAFVELAGRTLLEWAVGALEGHVDEIVVAVPALHVERVERAMPSLRVVVGGATRQETVARMAARASADIVLVHDVARPFLDAATVRACLDAARVHRACTVAAAVADSILDVERGEVVDRRRLRAVQTPQGFERALLLEAHAAATADGVEATDDAALVRRLGRHVALVEGGPQLFKITTASDLELARAYAARRSVAGPAA
jgi:2-C-methyl-D-erythritol 4-phosphate cytidylyltransferase